MRTHADTFAALKYPLPTGETSTAYFSASPPEFCTEYRRLDHLAAINHMNNARE
jgi:hypothetical protein